MGLCEGRRRIYYEGNASYRKHFGKYAQKYGFNGAFGGKMSKFESCAEYWGYLAAFLSATQNVPVREPYFDPDKLFAGKDFFVLTTNHEAK